MVLVVFALVPTVVRTLDVYGQGPATAAAASVGHPPGRQDTVTTCAAFGVPHASVCRKVELHVSIPTKHARGICAACVRRPCIWELLTKYKAYERSSGGGHAGYLFDKAYVVHYSPRAHRKARSIERLRAIGLRSDNNGSDNVAVVSEFDAEQIPARHVKCLVEASRPKCATGMTPGLISVNMKHYAAYYDMLRRGYPFGLVMEDDAAYTDGVKEVDNPNAFRGEKVCRVGARRHKALCKPRSHNFSVHLGYAHDSFRDVFTKEITPHLPVEGALGAPELIGGVVPNDPKRRNFDFLMLGACDAMIINRIEHAWHRQMPQYSGKGWHVTPLKGEAGRHLLAATKSCTRCGISYVVSLLGAIKVFLANQGFCHGVDLTLMLLSRDRPREGTFNCLHAYPNVCRRRARCLTFVVCLCCIVLLVWFGLVWFGLVWFGLVWFVAPCLTVSTRFGASRILPSRWRGKIRVQRATAETGDSECTTSIKGLRREAAVPAWAVRVRSMERVRCVVLRFEGSKAGVWCFATRPERGRGQRDAR